MLKVGFKVSIAGWSVDSTDDARTEVVEIAAERSLRGAHDHCRIVLYAPPAPKPDMLEQLAGAATEALFGGGEGGGEEFSIDVRGETIAHGDPVAIELVSGDTSATVMTATVHDVTSTFGLTTITGRTGMQILATTRLNQVYENRSFAQIVRDLAQQSGVQVANVATGSTYPYVVVHESKPVLFSIRELARREGADAYFDADGKLVVHVFDKSTADHVFNYGIDILDLKVHNREPTSARVVVYGESPSSQQGSDTWHWITKDVAPFQGEAGEESARMLALPDAALRTKDAADAGAKARLRSITEQATTGRLRLLGDPTVQPADAIEIKNAPKPELNGLFKVLSVRHRFSKQTGFLTDVDFSAIRPADEGGGGLLGALGQAAGALGL